MTNKGVLLSATACAVLLLAACGSSDKSSKSDSPPRTPREQLVLVESEFPAGAKKMDLPQDKLRDSLSDVQGTIAGATITPADCRGPQVDIAAAAKDILAKSSFALANTNDMATTYVDYVSSQTTDLSKMVDNYAKCPEVQVTSTTDGRQVDSTTKIEKLTVPSAISGTNAVAYHSTSSSSVGGDQPIVQNTYEGYATMRGMTVGVRATSLSGTPDQSDFDKFFTAAVQKVQNAK